MHKGDDYSDDAINVDVEKSLENEIKSRRDTQLERGRDVATRRDDERQCTNARAYHSTGIHIIRNRIHVYKIVQYAIALAMKIEASRSLAQP